MPREDRQLLMLRFVREVDQSVDYAEVQEIHHKPSKYVRERTMQSVLAAVVRYPIFFVPATKTPDGEACTKHGE